MHTVWALRREELLSDCLVSPDVFTQMVDRLGAFVMPSQHVLETEAGQRNVHLSLQGLLSSWRLASVDTEHGAKLPQNPTIMGLSGHNDM